MANIHNYGNYSNYNESPSSLITTDNFINQFDSMVGTDENCSITTNQYTVHCTNHPDSVSMIKNPDAAFSAFPDYNMYSKYINHDSLHDFGTTFTDNYTNINYMPAFSVNPDNQRQDFSVNPDNQRQDLISAPGSAINNTLLNYTANYKDDSVSASPINNYDYASASLINTNYTHPCVSASQINTNCSASPINASHISKAQNRAVSAPLLRTASCSLSTSSTGNNESLEIQHGNQYLITSNHAINDKRNSANYTSPEYNSNQNLNQVQLQATDKLISAVDIELYQELQSLIIPPEQLIISAQNSLIQQSHGSVPDKIHQHYYNSQPELNNHNSQPEDCDFFLRHTDQNPNSEPVQSTAMAAIHPSSPSIPGKSILSSAKKNTSDFNPNSSTKTKLSREQSQISSKAAIAMKTQSKNNTPAKLSDSTIAASKRSFTLSFDQHRNPEDSEDVVATIASLADAGVDESTLIAIAGPGISVDYGAAAKKTKLDPQTLSRHCESERKRRHKLKQNLEHLRALVTPSLSDKTDKASIIEAAVKLLTEKEKEKHSKSVTLKQIKKDQNTGDELQASCKVEQVDEGRSSSSMNESTDCSSRLSEVFCELGPGELVDLGDNVEAVSESDDDDGQLWRPDHNYKVFVRESRIHKGCHVISLTANSQKSGIFCRIIRALDELNLKILFANSYTLSNDFVTKIEIVDETSRMKGDLYESIIVAIRKSINM